MGPRTAYHRAMAKVRFGPARVPSRRSPKEAISMLQRRDFTACEIDFEGGFWMDYPWATRFGELAREAKIVLSVHAPIAGFMGHLERDKKQRMAVGMLDHSAGIAKAAGAELVVFHPGFLLGRERADTIASVCEQLAEFRERLEGKDRAVPFGVEVMGRVNDFGSLDDVIAIAGRCGWVRPVLDFAHMHATSDGAFTEVEPFAYANRNETRHLPYGQGTLRADPLRKALRRFKRPATVISESPDLKSTRAIFAALSASARTSSRRASSSAASSSRPRSARN